MKAETLQLHQKRRISEIITVSAQYLVANAKSLFVGIALLSLPLLGLAKLGAFLITGNPIALESVLRYKDIVGKNSFMLLIFCFILFITGICTYLLSIYKNVVLNTADAKDKEVTFETIKQDFGEDLNSFVINFLIIYLIYFVTKLGVDYINIWSRSSFASESFMVGVIAYYAQDFIIDLPGILVLSVCFYFCISTLFVCYRDKIGAADAMGKVWSLAQKIPQKTWLNCTLLFIVAYLLHFFFRIIINFTEFNFFYPYSTPLIRIISDLLKLALDCFIFAFFQIASILLFGSNEEEAEGRSIKTKIETV